VIYTVDGHEGEMAMPGPYLLVAQPEDMAELVASLHWRTQPIPPPSCTVHLKSVDGLDLGVFEVKGETRAVFTAKALRQG
ncbi:hypothetical protein Q7C30_000115, partial [Pseudomonas sp. RAC1]